MNLPNKLTLFRIILVPIMVIVSFFDIPGSFLGISTTMWIMELIFIIASITDKLDGYLARKNNQVTNFGKFLDPIADKILVVAAMILFVEMGRLPAWIPIIVIFREFAVSGYRLIAVQNSGKVIAANVWGKLKTVTQMIAIILMFLTTQPYFAFVMRAKTEQDALVNSALTSKTSGGDDCLGDFFHGSNSFTFIAIRLFNATATALNCISQLYCLDVALIS